jgi:hypothetical protein
MISAPEVTWVDILIYILLFLMFISFPFFILGGGDILFRWLGL